ncbi:MAG: phosphatase PAP2 family protein [Lachnospiraceae bacterium]|nr:phosphatase PAP2 family protein [Lachnospiraceae bacterium]
MNREKYLRVMSCISSKKYGTLSVKIAGKLLTYITGIIYMLTILSLLYGRDTRVIKVILVPAVSFILLSVFRHLYNAERPYEKYGFEPLIHKDTKGKSFPSRHVFSIYMCGSAVMYIIPSAGVIIYIMGLFLAVIRVVTGVHFIKDVCAGALAGVICGIIGFIII